jgi:CubicO group peptidase (beta-lactamase class C family)
MLEAISGRSWEDLIREKLWQPLGLTSGGFGAPGTPGQIDQP